MTVPPRSRRLGTLVGAAVALSGALLIGGCAPPVSTGPTAAPSPTAGSGATEGPSPRPSRYVALGDSYAAGLGAGDYQDDCGTSPNGYASLLASDPVWEQVGLHACSGATTGDVVAGQLAGLDERTDTVTLTIGANDLGVRALGETCFSNTPDVCRENLAAGMSRLGGLSTSLAETYGAIRSAAPGAVVYVTGYPLLVEQPANESEAAINDGMALLNDVIESSVVAAGAGFVYVDVEAALAGHLIGSAEPWIIPPPDAEAFHPNAAGHRVYAEAVERAMREPS